MNIDDQGTAVEPRSVITRDLIMQKIDFYDQAIGAFEKCWDGVDFATIFTARADWVQAFNARLRDVFERE